METIVLTPNLTGRDGISQFARSIVRASGATSVVTLHEPASSSRFDQAEVYGAGGSAARFGAAALQQASRTAGGTCVILVHIHLAPAALAFAARGASLVTFLCGIEAWQPMTWAQRAAIHRSREVVSISQHTIGRFRTANPRLADCDVVVCHPGIDAGAAAAAPGARRRALIVGRMAQGERYKGHDALLEVWSAVARAVPGASLDVVGDGDDRARLEARARSLGLGDAVTFLGSVSDEEREHCYERASLFVMPSRDEGFGLVFLEAMRAARPCLAMRGSASEIIDDGRTGVLVEPDGDPAVLTAGLVSVLGDPARAAAMGRAGRERFLERFTSEQFKERLDALLSRAAPAGAGA